MKNILKIKCKPCWLDLELGPLGSLAANCSYICIFLLVYAHFDARSLHSIYQVERGHYYGYVYFRQMRDKTIKRGYFQKVRLKFTLWILFKLQGIWGESKLVWSHCIGHKGIIPGLVGSAASLSTTELECAETLLPILGHNHRQLC